MRRVQKAQKVYPVGTKFRSWSLLRMINEQHNILDTKILKNSDSIVKSILFVMVVGHLKIIWELMKIQDMLKK